MTSDRNRVSEHVFETTVQVEEIISQMELQIALMQTALDRSRELSRTIATILKAKEAKRDA